MHDFLVFAKHMWRLTYLVRAVLLGLLVLLVVLGVVLAWVEALPLGEALYLTAITGLTVGYGDVVPTTAAGRAVCVAAAVTGLVLAGLYVGLATKAVALMADELLAHAHPGPRQPAAHRGRNED